MSGDARAWTTAALVVVAAGCGGANRPASSRVMPLPTVAVGACGEPERDGVIGASPRLERADRDLDGDGSREAVVVDRGSCTADGNCYWNLFRRPAAAEIDPAACERYVGTVAGVGLEPLATVGDHGMPDLRSVWALGDDRVLVQDYRFVAGGYRLTDAVPCRRMDDSRLQCAVER
ncbi:MAG: hypothetical protein R2939_14285 [Kofleriaceae bacterium]